jgi:hypothetical protein
MSNNILKFNRNNIKQVEELSTHCSEVAEQTWKFISHLNEQGNAPESEIAHGVLQTAIANIMLSEDYSEQDIYNAVGIIMTAVNDVIKDNQIH